MSCSLWRYTPACDGRACPGECDACSFEPGEPEIVHCRECRFAKPKSVKIGEPTEWTCTKYNAVRYGGEFCSRGEAREWHDCGTRMDAQIGEDKSHPFAESVMMGMDGGENG